MTFQERHLLQEDFGQDNRMKYLKGGLAGAGIASASHIMGAGDDSKNNTGDTWMDDLRTDHNEGNLWNGIVQKGQDAVGWFKSDDSGGAESAAKAVESIVNG